MVPSVDVVPPAADAFVAKVALGADFLATGTRGYRRDMGLRAVNFGAVRRLWREGVVGCSVGLTCGRLLARGNHSEDMLEAEA